MNWNDFFFLKEKKNENTNHQNDLISSVLCPETSEHNTGMPKDGVGGCQKMKMYSSDPDIAVWQPV